MRAVEKSELNDLILKGEENLKAEKEKHAGQWARYYVPDVFNQMIAELETLRKELEERTVEVCKQEHY